MNKLTYQPVYNLLLFFTMAAIMASLAACKKNKDGALPVITEVRNYEAAPNDTVITSLNTGQWVVLLGSNFSGVTQVLFGSVPATINNALFTDDNMVVQVPAIPFQTVQRDKVNEITVISAEGATTYTINIIGAPLITHIRNYAASPNDTIVNAIIPGQKVNIIGYNLKNASRITFQGVAANLSGVIFSDSGAVVQVPGNLSGGDASQANMIGYTTPVGTGTFSIKIIGPPIITSVSNENPNAGDSVYLYGNNFINVQSVSFAGVSVASFTTAVDGNSVAFITPTLTQSGPVVITTPAGTFTTAFNVNDATTGIISNFEWGPLFKWDWWGGASLASGDPGFPGNSTQYLILKSNSLNGGAGDEFSTAIRMSNVQWMPAASLTDPVNSWALKFETSIPGAWKGGSLCIKSANGSYMARYEPWQITPSTTETYTTKGWQTVTIPFSSFRKNDATLGDGKGAPIAAISDLLGATGTSDLILYLHNYGTAPTATAFGGAFDNFRVIKR